MTTTIATVRRWLDEPAHTFAARLLVYAPLLFSGTVGLVAALWYLVSGHVAGGRPAAAVLLCYAVASAGTFFAAVRGAGRIRHLVVGVVLVALLDQIDVWVRDGHVGSGRFPGYPLLLAAGLLYNLARFARRERAGRLPAAAGAAAVGPTAD